MAALGDAIDLRTGPGTGTRALQWVTYIYPDCSSHHILNLQQFHRREEFSHRGRRHGVLRLQWISWGALHFNQNNVRAARLLEGVRSTATHGGTEHRVLRVGNGWGKAFPAAGEEEEDRVSAQGVTAAIHGQDRALGGLLRETGVRMQCCSAGGDPWA